MTSVLSSDILERQFGPTGLEVLQQDGTGRVICTKAAGSGQVLELSHVVFHQAGIAAFPEIHRDVTAGTSMGKAFAGQHIAFKRQVRAICSYERQNLPDSFSARFGEQEAPTVVDVSILVGPDTTPYADILEVYSPAVTWQPDGGGPGLGLAERVRAFDKLLTKLDG